MRPHSHVPRTPDPLREFLRDRITPTRLCRIASADYDRDGDGIARELRANLDTGKFTYTGDGNPYEVALMQRYDMTTDRPLNELFGGWWLGTFCSDPEHVVLIDNLPLYGVGALLGMVVRGCGELGEESTPAAHAAIPFVLYLQDRVPETLDHLYTSSLAAMDAIETKGSAAVQTSRYRDFMALIEYDTDD